MRMPDYQVTGEGAVTVFLLHGIYGSKDYWRYQTERLIARGYRVVAWDALCLRLQRGDGVLG